MGNIERSIECDTGCGDCWACDLKNMKRDRDRWLREYRIEKQNNTFLRDDLEGAVNALRDAIAAVSGPVRYMPSSTYTPQIGVLRVEEWKKVLNALEGGK